MKVVIDQKYFCLFESIGKRIRFSPGEFVFCESDEANESYLIVKGRVQVYLGTSSGKQTTIEVLKEGRIFGDASFLEHSVRKANIVAITDVELICCRITDDSSGKFRACASDDEAFDVDLQLSDEHDQSIG